MKWLSRLKYLWVIYTDEVMSMRRILEATDNLVDLDLPRWTTLEKASSNTIRSLALRSDPLHLKSLKELVCPQHIGLNVALSQMLRIDGGETILSGTADSLVLWRVTGLVASAIYFVPCDGSEQVENSVKKTRLLFQLNPSIQCLTLRCNAGGDGGNQHHINKVLELLDTLHQSQKSGTIAGGEADPSSGAIDTLLLPYLVKLIVEDPITLDGKLLQKIVKSRTHRNSEFQLEFIAGKEVVVIDDWEARGWMN